MAKKKRSRKADFETETVAPPKKPRRRIRTLLVLLLVVFVGAVAAAPTILSQTSLGNYLLGMAFPAEGWQLEAQSTSLSWSGSQNLSGLSLVGPDGQPLFSAESIRCNRSLIGLVSDWTNLGKIEVTQPRASIVTRNDGSNVEDLLDSMNQESSEPSAESPAITVELEVLGGEIHALDTTTHQKWSLTEAQIQGHLDKANYQLTGGGKLTLDQTGDASEVKFDLKPDESGQQHLSLLAERLPLEVLRPWVARSMPGAQLSGTLSVDAPEVRWKLDPKRGLLVQTQGKIVGEQISFTADALEGDRLYCEKLNAPWRVVLVDNQIAVKQLSINAGWTQLHAHGRLPLSALAAQSMSQVPDSEFSIQGDVNLPQIAAMLPNALQLQDGVRVDSGQLTIDAGGRSQSGSLGLIANATLSNLTGSNRGRQIRLNQPIQSSLRVASTAQGFKLKLLSLGSSFAETTFIPSNEATIQGEFTFDLEKLASEMGQFVDLSAWQLMGKGQAQMTLIQAPDQQFPTDISQLQGSIKGLRVISDTISIDEPRVNFSGQAKWDPETNSFAAPEFDFAGSTVSLRARDLSYTMNEENQARARGNVAFSVNLERIAGILSLLQKAEATWPRGIAEGTLQLSSQQGSIEGNLRAHIKQLQLLQNPQVPGRPEILWNEPQLQVSTVARYDSSADRVQVSNLVLQGKTLQLSGNVSIDQLSSTQMLQTQGQLQYDAQELARLLVGYLGPEVQVRGDQKMQFAIAGPLSELNASEDPLAWAKNWSLAADAGWVGASLYGLPVGSGKFAGEMRNGQILITPLNVQVGEGKLTASPQIRLAQGAEQVFLPQGPLLTNVGISPQVSQNVLKYIAPVLAGATRTTGEFSVSLGDTQVPLDNPLYTSITGQLSVHRLNIEPGPMMQEMETIIRQLKSISDGKEFLTASASRKMTALRMADRSVDFQVAQGRVYHRNLVFEIDDVPITSQGSVGFDQTLDLVFNIPLQEKWLGKNLKSMVGQTIQIPVQGTFQNPRVDSRVIAELSSRFLQNAATGLIENEVNRQLDKLFRGR